MVIDLAECGDARTFSAAVCVIGSGPAGGLVAGGLAAAGYDVILLEAGTDTADLDESETIARQDVSGQIGLRFGFSRQLGGSSNLWAGRVAPLEPIDFESRGWVPDSGWPIARAALETHYKRAADLMGIPWPFPQAADPLAITDLAGGTGEETGGSLEMKRFLWSNDPFNVAAYLRKTAFQSRGRLRLIASARVAALQGRERAIEVAQVVGPDGRRVDVSANYFVVAAGGLESPRLLLNSTSVRPNGIGNDHDVLGRYFSTHPKADMAVLLLDRSVSLGSGLFEDHKLADSCVRYGVGLTARAQAAQKTLNHCVQLSPVVEYQASRLFEALKGQTALASPFIDKSRIGRRLLPGLGRLTHEVLHRLAGLQRRGRLFTLRAFLDQYPNRDNRVTRSAQVDRFGRNKVDLAWAFSQRDRQSVLSFFATLASQVRKRGLGRVEYEPLHTMPLWPLVGIHSHFMGTTRMGDDPRTAVVDGDCKVYGYENLFVSGPSTFPAYGYANPFLTIAALAMRLADHLKVLLATRARPKAAQGGQ
jgi:choline dehydrogenase-like flavoprotein